MATTYEPADGETYGLLKDLYLEHRDDLANTDAKILLLFAYGDDGKPAMKCRGMRAMGTCKVHCYKDKVQGKPDATITLDGTWWLTATPRQRLALLHHELSHIDVYHGELDALGRCDLRSRRGDWDGDGFHEVLALYGEDSCEYHNLQTIAEHHRQMRFRWTAAERERDQAEPPADPGTEIVISGAFTAPESAPAEPPASCNPGTAGAAGVVGRDDDAPHPPPRSRPQGRRSRGVAGGSACSRVPRGGSLTHGHHETALVGGSRPAAGPGEGEP